MAVLAILMVVGLFFALVVAVAFGAAAGAAAGHAGLRRVGGFVLGAGALLFFFLLLAAPSRGVYVSVADSDRWRQPLPVAVEPHFHPAAWKIPPLPSKPAPPIPQEGGPSDWEGVEPIEVVTTVAPAAAPPVVDLTSPSEVVASPRIEFKLDAPPAATTQPVAAPDGPAAWADAPEGRKPEWVDQNAGRQQGVYSKTVHSGRFSTKDEASQDLTQQVELALREQLVWSGLPVPTEWIPRPELVRSAVAAVWCEPLSSERLGATVYRLHAQTRFPKHLLDSAASDVRRQIGRERSDGVRSLGLWVLGGLGIVWLGARGCRCGSKRPWPPAA